MRRLAVLLPLLGWLAVPGWAAPACASFPVGAWATVDAPVDVADYVVAADDPKRLYVTDGTVVVSSADGGCTWTESLRQLDVPIAPRVSHLAVAATDPDVVYAALGSAAASRPSVVRTTDGGATWTQAAGGLETVQGRPLQVVVAPGHADIAYLVVEGNRVAQGDVAAEITRSLYATTDGGATWEQRDASPLLVGDTATFEGVAIDPRNSDVVWLYGGFGLWRSNDGARTSGQMVPGDASSGGGAIGYVDLFHSVDVSRVLAFGSERPVAFGSFDGGRRFSPIALSSIIRSSATGRRFTEIAVASDTNVVYQAGAESPPRQITPSGPSARDLRVAFGSTPVFYARTTDSLLRWTAAPDPPGTRGPGARPVPRDPASVSIPRLPPLPASTLDGPPEVSLAAGRSATVPYTLDLPGVQRADIYFLVDVSASMQQEIDGLRSALAGIVTDLVASNVDAWFGVGRFNTYDGEPYFRVVPVVAPGPELEQALEVLVASGGGERKSQLEAVYQSATGAGGSAQYAPTALGPGGSYFIPAKQEAGFRPAAPVKLVLNITDEPFFEQAPSPSYDEVGAALRAGGIKQLGLALDNGDVLPALGPGPEAGLRRLADSSGALAPPGGVDCDGDGRADIDEGRPLVCVMPSERSGEATVLANAIVNLVRSLPNRGSVDFSVSGGPEARLNRTSFPVEFKQTIRRSVEVTYTCPADVTAETEFAYEVAASAGGSPLATASTTVRCSPLVAPALRDRPPVAAGVAPAPQVPAGNSNMNPNPNPNPQSQPQAQGNPAAVAEREEQEQIHVAEVDVESGELAMSLLGVSALVAGAALGLRPAGTARAAAAGYRRHPRK